MEKHPHPTGMRAGKGPQSRAKHAHQRLKRLVNITKLVFFGSPVCVASFCGKAQ